MSGRGQASCRKLPETDEIREILRGVRDPELGHDIVELGMFRDATVDEATGQVTVNIALTIAGCPLRNQIRREVESKISGLPGVTQVQVEMGELSQQERSALMDRVRRMMHENPRPTEISPTTRVLAIASGKGGVGKSSLSVNLAAATASRGHVVGLLDADIWGFSAPKMLGLKGRLGGADGKIDPISTILDKGVLKVVSMGFLVEEEDQALMWRGLILSRAVEQFLQDVRWGNDLDYLFIDMPPGTGDVQMALSRLLPQTEMIVVTTPQENAERIAIRVADMARRSYLKIAGVIENMSAFYCNHGERYEIFGRGGGENLANKTASRLLGSVPVDEAILRGAEAGVPTVLGEPDSLAALELNRIAEQIVSEIAPPIAMERCTARIFDVTTRPPSVPAQGGGRTSVSISNS